jgi:hypothetical protein
MKINWKKEIYSITIKQGDANFKQYAMDNRSYARINGKWHLNSGGNELDFHRMGDEELTSLLEAEFQSMVREEKLNKLLC